MTLCQAGPDIGDMELRRNMLEPEVTVVARNNFCNLSCLQDEDFRPASEVFGKGGMDLDYLNQVRVSSSIFRCHLERHAIEYLLKANAQNLFLFLTH